MSEKLNRVSARITQPKSQGASQAMLYGVGLTEADMHKPQVGISSVWYEGNPCNMHLNDLAAEVKTGWKRPVVGLRFNTIGVSDGISMGTEGMSYSLPSRDLIADSIETVMRAQWYDANISLPGCDKNMPGCIMAMARVNRPALMVYGGTIRAGHLDGRRNWTSFRLSRATANTWPAPSTRKRQAIVRNSCPGAGACGGMYTANTMASAIEAMGMSLPFSASRPGRIRTKTTNAAGPARRSAICSEARHQAAGHHDPRGLRKRHDSGA
jgi:dihydroxy-acid dehydratase